MALIETFILALAVAAGADTARAQDGEGAPALPEVFVTQLDQAIDGFKDRNELPALAIGVIIDDALVYTRCLGTRSLDSDEPINERTLFQIGSITKSFTTTLAAMQVARGAISWDDPIDQHLPEWWRLTSLPEDSPALTIRLLANHRSGLPGRPPTLPPEQDDGLVRVFSQFQLHQSVERATLERAPDTAFGYSNFGYAILGVMLEDFTQTSYEQLLARDIFEPLGMDDSTITIMPRHVDLIAKPYARDRESGETSVTLPQNLDSLAPAGGIFSSVHDLAPFLAFHMGAPEASQRIDLDRAQIEALRVGHPTGPESSLLYALGWGLTDLDIGTIVFHDGRCDGYTAYIGYAPEDRVGAIVLTNLGLSAAAGPVRALGHGLLNGVVNQLRSDQSD